MFEVNKTIVAGAALLFGLCYFGYVQYQDKKQAQRELIKVSGKLNQLQNHIEKTNQIVAEREQEKAQASIELQNLQEKLQHALKDNQCANEFMPDDVVNWMRNGKN